MPEYERTSLWIRGLAVTSDDPHENAKERLRTAYRQFWANAVTLSREIQRDLPSLTLHDDAHFDALWARADQIAGQNYELTPLETFILGGAILLHDAANSIAAFPGRLDEIQSTPEWKDVAAEWFDKNGVDPASSLPSDAVATVLFETLRSAHAERAATLASIEFKVGDRRFCLLQDDQLRAHLGGLIGEIAASHHWDISTLTTRLPDRRGPLSGMPQSWIVRPIVLACLLRCADATQLDQQRAPDFLYGLLHLRGLSEHHWRAQNRLSTPHIDPDDEHALTFTSTMPFTESDSEAWWIAHDAIQVANRELQASEALLRDLRLPPLAINRVSDAGSPKRLSAHVTVSGWRPVAAEVKVSQVEKIVDMFGGEKLYGHQMAVPIRELIQNAADAINFRRALEPPGSGYVGSITVKIKPIEGSSTDSWVTIEDDGLGMSEAVLTGPLIDFGSSYVSSPLVKSERPGLFSKGKKRIGKFGIGFFSAFMLGDEVLVTSRPFDEGLNSCRTLQFRKGFIARPLLLDSKPSDFGASLSTRVAVRATAERVSDMLKFHYSHGQNSKPINLAQLVGMLCPMLDVDVFVDENGCRSKIHSRTWHSEDRSAWINRILLPDLRNWAEFPKEVERSLERISLINKDDPSCGLACISSISGAGVATVGTLRAGEYVSSFMDEILGTIDYEAEDPRRMRGAPRARDQLGDWATEQAILARNADLSPQERQRIAERVSYFGGDATPIAGIKLNRNLVPITNILTRLSEGKPLFMPIKNQGFRKDESFCITQVRERHYGLLDNYSVGELEFILDTLESSGTESLKDVYYDIPSIKNPAPYSFVAILERLAKTQNLQIDGEFLERIEFAKYVGQQSLRENLVPGKIIGCPGLRITAKSI